MPSSFTCLEWCMESTRYRKLRTLGGSSLSWSSGLLSGRLLTPMCWLTGEWPEKNVSFIHYLSKHLLNLTANDLFVFPNSMEDLTDPEAIRLNPKCDRTVSLYGYLRGTFLKNKCQVHIPGELSLMFAKFFTDIQIFFFW